MVNFLIPVYVRALNGLITILFFPFLINIYYKEKKRLYLYWAIGFILYGLNIVTRALIDLYNITIFFPQLISFILYSTGCMFLLIGIGDLINKARNLFYYSLTIPFFMILLYLTIQSIPVAKFISSLPIIQVCAALIYIQIKYDVDIKLFVYGWVMLLLSNLALIYGFASDVLVDSIAILAKGLVFYGMFNPKFIGLARDFERFLISGKLSEYFDDPTWHLRLAESQINKEQEMFWLKQIVTENSKRGIRTVLLSVYDIISVHDLDVQGILDWSNLYVIRMYQKGRIQQEALQEQITTINDNILELDIMLSDLIDFTTEKKVRVQLIVHSLSTLVHVHGYKRLYSLFLSKMPKIKSSDLQVYLLYYPQSHSDDYITNLFRKTVDEVIQLT